MNKDNNLITAARFLALLQDEDEFSRIKRNPTTVTNDVYVDGKEINITRGEGEKKIQPIRLENFSFTGGVHIRNFDALSFTADNSNFVDGISFEGCTGHWLSIRNCRLKDFRGFSNTFEHLGFEKIEGLPPENPKYPHHPILTISGFKVSREFVLKEVKLQELALTCHTEDLFQAAAAKVDDPLWALQLQLAGIKVYVDTSVAAKMLEKGSFAERLARPA